MTVKKQVVNWEDLAKKLQKSLEDQIDENEKLERRLEEMYAQAIKFQGVVEYLERKIGNSKL